MMTSPTSKRESERLTRRSFLKMGGAGTLVVSATPILRGATQPTNKTVGAIAKRPYLTPPEKFRTFVREKPPVDRFSPEKRRQIGLDRETWWLDVTADQDGTCSLERPFSKDQGTALTWPDLMRLAQRHTTRFLHVLTCTNVAKPFGVGLWEGVPLREVLWRTKPSPQARRVYYWGYHNEDPKQRFISSLPIGRVLEDPPGELPVILCYKLNGRWLEPKNGGPVRLFVPGVYGNKSVKWLQQVAVTSQFKANDTYAEWQNDVETAMKTQARFVETPKSAKTGEQIPLVGIAQVGMSGLSQVQYAVEPAGTPPKAEDPFSANLNWQEAQILGPPQNWGGEFPDGQLPPVPLQFDPNTSQPRNWPMRYTLAHWSAQLTAPVPGKYRLRCRTIDANGLAQPMPRPFPRSGKNTLHEVMLTVEA
jgi:DMSO/TMAO reductase YedYZ molybdopterin-dependent catalytic subunit